MCVCVCVCVCVCASISLFKQIEIPQERRLSGTLKYTHTHALTSLSAWTSLKFLLLEMNYLFVMCVFGESAVDYTILYTTCFVLQCTK